MHVPPSQNTEFALARWSSLLLAVCALLFGAIPAPAAEGDLPSPENRLAKTEIHVDPKSGLCDLEANDDILSVLAALRDRTGVGLIYDGRLKGRVQLSLRQVTAREAVQRVATSVGLKVDAQEGVLLIRKPRPEDRVQILEKDGLFRAPVCFRYAVLCVSRRPEQQPLLQSLSRLELTPGVSLVVAPDLQQRVVQEIAEHSAVYRRILKLAGDEVHVPRAVPSRNIRIYVKTTENLYFGEALIEASPNKLLHLVFIFDAVGQKPIRRLVAFHTSLNNERD